jgi:RNA polymerase-interacting CarD/CdnL/TRCF family regulator
MRRSPIFGLHLLLIAALLAAPMSFILSSNVRAEEKVKKSELDKKMEVMDEGMKKLKRTLKKPDENPASLKVVTDIIDAATACRDMVPLKVEKLPEADRKKAVEEYKAAMTKTIATMQEMKKAIEAGDNAKALELHKSLKSMEEDGHDKFKEEGDDPDKPKTDKGTDK